MPMEKPCCKGLSCEADPLQYVYRCEEKGTVFEILVNDFTPCILSLYSKGELLYFNL